MNRWLRASLAALLSFALIMAPLPVIAAGAPQVSVSWLPLGRLASPIAVTNASAATALPAGGDVVNVCNTGSNDAYVAAGGSTITVLATTGSWVKASTCAAIQLRLISGSLATFIATITASSTTTLNIETGIGTPPASLAASGGGGGGAATIANGADVAEGSTTDAACASSVSTCTVVSVLKGILAALQSLVSGLLTPPIAMNYQPSSSGTFGLTPVQSASIEPNHIIKASAGNLYSFEVSVDTTVSPTPWWIMIYNATTAPGDGPVTPTKCYAMPSNTTQFSAAFNVPVQFSTGITIGVSTTGCFTKTAAGNHAFIGGDAQ